MALSARLGKGHSNPAVISGSTPISITSFNAEHPQFTEITLKPLIGPASRASASEQDADGLPLGEGGTASGSPIFEKIGWT